MSGEAHSRTEITLPDCQRALTRAVRKAGKPLIVVLSTGRALALDDSLTGAEAILVAWFLGSESGNALSDILLGSASPSGRLPVSFPQQSGQQPFFYNHKSTGGPQLPGKSASYKARYIEVSHEPLFPFGFGLGYSAVSYGTAKVDQPRMGWDSAITISAQIRSDSARAVEEVVQLYLRDVTASVTRPVRELKGYRRIALQPGEARNVQFRVSRRDLEFVGNDLKWQTEPGEFLAWIAPNSRDGAPTGFMLERA